MDKDFIRKAEELEAQAHGAFTKPKEPSKRKPATSKKSNPKTK